MQNPGIQSFLKKNLLIVTKPIQYLGNEIYMQRKQWSTSKAKICLLYPDKYEVGMSNLAVNLFYTLINSYTKHSLERAFIPDLDMITLLKDNEVPLFSLESQKPLANFDALAVSFSTELSFTNALLALDLARIPRRSKDRLDNEQWPLIFAGGGGVMNPLPMSIFMDFFVLGDGEEVFKEICDKIHYFKYKKVITKIEILSELNNLDYIFVPLLNEEKKVFRHIYKDFADESYLEKPLIPLLKTVHNRFSIEIMRGCPRKCRFCQASYINKPVRIKPKEKLIKQVKNIIMNTGYDEISLSSLSSSDYPYIKQLLEELEPLCKEKQVSLSLPSLRMDTFSNDVSLMINKVRQSGVTLAPEAGSQFLRDVINKDLSEDEIISTAKIAAQNSGKSIKLYFMIGLPGETDQDVEDIVNLSFRIIREIKPAHNKVVVNVSNFVPKPFTPFQWAGQESIPEITRKLNFLKAQLRHHQLELRWTDPQVSQIEGLLSRGDEETGELIEQAYKNGAFFDAWYDHFRFDAWQKAIEQCGLKLEGYLTEKAIKKPLPWDFVETGVKKEFLLKEYEKALALKREKI
ncbi:MAG: radical SAM protein [Candidatus Margulisbacteria bacterium]|nr:radical SAM protein [Candidatus Margulisiibacteriota bacterium]